MFADHFQVSCLLTTFKSHVTDCMDLRVADYFQVSCYRLPFLIGGLGMISVLSALEQVSVRFT